MPRATRLLAEARLDIEEAFDWYLERSSRAAEGFLHEVEGGIALVVESPTVWPEYVASTRKYQLRRYPFNVVYQEVGDTIVIVAIAHQKRLPGYWMGREA